MTTKQVSIKEGTTARTFENVGRLVTHDQQGTEEIWVPEEAVMTEDDGYVKDIEANGYYEPESSLGKYFKAVNVSVPQISTSENDGEPIDVGKDPTETIQFFHAVADDKQVQLTWNFKRWHIRGRNGEDYPIKEVHIYRSRKGYPGSTEELQDEANLKEVYNVSLTYKKNKKKILYKKRPKNANVLHSHKAIALVDDDDIKAGAKYYYRIKLTLASPVNNWSSVDKWNAKNSKALAFALDDVSWADGTDAQIAEMVKLADDGVIDLSDYWEVGDERVVKLNALKNSALDIDIKEGEYTLVLLSAGGKNLFLSADRDGHVNSKPCNFVVGFKTYLDQTVSLHSNSTPVRWVDCDMRKFLNTDFKNVFSSTFAGIFKSFLNPTARFTEKYETTEYPNPNGDGSMLKGSYYHITEEPHKQDEEIVTDTFTIPSITELTGADTIYEMKYEGENKYLPVKYTEGTTRFEYYENPRIVVTDGRGIYTAAKIFATADNMLAILPGTDDETAHTYSSYWTRNFIDSRAFSSKLSFYDGANGSEGDFGDGYDAIITLNYEGASLIVSASYGLVVYGCI